MLLPPRLCWHRTRRNPVPLAGHVYKSDGKPLAGARVFLFPLEAAVEGPLPAVVSGDDGSYRSLTCSWQNKVCASLDFEQGIQILFTKYSLLRISLPGGDSCTGCSTGQCGYSPWAARRPYRGHCHRQRKTGVIVASARIRYRSGRPFGIHVGGCFAHGLFPVCVAQSADFNRDQRCRLSVMDL